MNISETNQLTPRFGSIDAVRDLTLVVPQGSVFALLGANGAGKTTAIKVMMNLLAPCGGTARVLGVDSQQLGEREFCPDWLRVREPEAAGLDDCAATARLLPAVLPNVGPGA